VRIGDGLGLSAGEAKGGAWICVWYPGALIDGRIPHNEIVPYVVPDSWRLLIFTGQAVEIGPEFFWPCARLGGRGKVNLLVSLISRPIAYLILVVRRVLQEPQPM
jgi:hypothetical protein